MRCALFVVLSLLVTRPVLADVIGADWRPPQCPALDCAPGSSPAPSGSHSGCSPGCGPNRECAADGDCAALGAGARCVDTRFCVGEGSASRIGPVPIVRGECAADGPCAEGTCSAVRRCVAPPPSPAPTKAPPPASWPDEVVVEGPEGEEAPPERHETPRAEGGGCAVRSSSREAGAPFALLAAVLAVWIRRRR